MASESKVKIKDKGVVGSGRRNGYPPPSEIDHTCVRKLAPKTKWQNGEEKLDSCCITVCVR